MLPSDFWEEFDRRLDEKLEQKLEQKLKPIRSQINEIVKWTQRQDKSLERELNDAVHKHFLSQNRGFIIVKPEKFLKHFMNENGIEITEFDGVFILTNIPKYTEETIVKAGEGQIYLIIIECKQHVTNHKLTRKMKQKQQIEKIMSDIRNGTINVKPEYEQLKYFEPQVGFYIGGLEFNESVIPTIKELIELDKTNKFIGWIDLNGNRFTVHDQYNDFGTAIGGKNKKRI